MHRFVLSIVKPFRSVPHISLKTCILGEYLFDYLIIDESYQVDIIKSADKEIIKPKHSLIKRTL